MAFAQAMSPHSPQHLFRDIQFHDAGHPSANSRLTNQRQQRFYLEFSQCLFDFVIQLLPTTEEMTVKEDVRKLLERLIRTIEPDSRLLSFGSTANGFSLRNSDMDLCCLIDSKERLSASDLVTMLSDLLERETKFHVKPLPHARIPIVKLTLDPSPGLPLGIACDIGFENRLALENTRLLMCYAMIDPTRVRTIVLFLKVWSKRRKINSPYKGTLSSYGYVLLHAAFAAYLQGKFYNHQSLLHSSRIMQEETYVGEYNTWFFDDIDLLRQRWHSENTETVAELLSDFFRYFSREFLYNTAVISLREGTLKKFAKGWQNDLSPGKLNDARERNRFCIEDPFETDYNVARCVTRDGLYTIRGEFMRALRILMGRPDPAVLAIAELCKERPDEELVTAPPARLSHLPPQTPYTVGSSPMRSRGSYQPSDRFSPTVPFDSRPRLPIQQRSVPGGPIPSHMAPKRSKWTSPPPPEAPPSDHKLFESQLGKSIELATARSDARERDSISHSSSSNSEILTDEDRSEDDLGSVHSYTEGSALGHISIPLRRVPRQDTPSRVSASEATAFGGPAGPGPSVLNPKSSGRGRRDEAKPSTEVKPPSRAHNDTPRARDHRHSSEQRRSLSGPSRAPKAYSWSPVLPISLAATVPLPPSPAVGPDLGGVRRVPPANLSSATRSSSPSATATSIASTSNNVSNSASSNNNPTVYYQTTVPRSPHSMLYPVPGSRHQSPVFSQFPYPMPLPLNDVISTSSLPPSLSHRRESLETQGSASDTPTLDASFHAHAQPSVSSSPAAVAPRGNSSPSPHQPAGSSKFIQEAASTMPPRLRTTGLQPRHPQQRMGEPMPGYPPLMVPPYSNLMTFRYPYHPQVAFFPSQVPASANNPPLNSRSRSSSPATQDISSQAQTTLPLNLRVQTDLSLPTEPHDQAVNDPVSNLPIASPGIHDVPLSLASLHDRKDLSARTSQTQSLPSPVLSTTPTVPSDQHIPSLIPTPQSPRSSSFGLVSPDNEDGDEGQEDKDSSHVVLSAVCVEEHTDIRER
ncbi:hypothetical protein FISHEDRAFT_74468 [Fistulina hepatica ATCC 64428]|uniref:polynucleotide adenylyltransferase n=1 Tax=Fistulina hepatica ATCC 64428 TaxID=1128425 RepID=A0A0D7ACK4_9AGAR|nr:hypothetical protein FISHEDRAFT_74468 [Fistulina hepatica ATCC 64428]